MVPAHAEFVIEGSVSATETMLEGPFGDHTGFYSDADEYPVINIKAITRKKSPIYPATIVGRPPMEDCFFGKATERIFLPLIRLQLPEITDINLPCEGAFHNCVIVAIKKEYPGHARKVASALWGMGQMMFVKVVIIVDEDVNVQNLSEVAWKALSSIDPERDTFMVKGPLDVLDHASPQFIYGSKIGIDATRKLKEEGHARPWPEEIKMSPEIKALVSRRWKEYGFE
jgi:4-hydroxy-3-polyprenylbenzoate decarboxylase